jgi:hypothetical protein
MKRKCVIVHDGRYLKGIETLPMIGRAPVWVPDLERARIFESKACANDILKGYWFDSYRNRCGIRAVEQGRLTTAHR